MLDAARMLEVQKPKPPGELDAVLLVGDRIKDLIGEEEYNIFMKSKDIMSVYNKPYSLQRYTINTWVRNSVYAFMGKTKKDMSHVLQAALDDGAHADWMRLLVIYVFPVLKNYKVITKVYT